MYKIYLGIAKVASRKRGQLQYQYRPEIALNPKGPCTHILDTLALKYLYRGTTLRPMYILYLSKVPCFDFLIQVLQKGRFFRVQV